MKKGFTLIELLVVVLIIGILAAVALPQYQKAVNKTRVYSLVSMLSTVIKAEEIYYLSNGTYTADWSKLDISFAGKIQGVYLSSTQGWTLQLGSSGMAVATDERLPGLKLYFGCSKSTNPLWSNRRSCYANINNEQAQTLCHYVTQHEKLSYTGDNSYIYDF